MVLALNIFYCGKCSATVNDIELVLESEMFYTE
jgi:hypothetical protein